MTIPDALRQQVEEACTRLEAEWKTYLAQTHVFDSKIPPTYAQAACEAFESWLGEEVYVLFDGPPSHESGRFVEVETDDGRGVGGIPWEEAKGYWRLGPLNRLRNPKEQG